MIFPIVPITTQVFDMESIKIVYYHGHLYNAKTKERIVLKEGSEYLIALNDINSITTESFEPPKQIRNGSEIFEEIRGFTGVSHIKKIKSKNDFLYFYISNLFSQKISKQAKESWFRIRLMEDLFIYSCAGWKNRDLVNKGKLADCHCVVDKSERQELAFFENIYAKSITSAIKRTHIHYFGNMGSPSKNSFDSIYINMKRDNENSLEVLRGFSANDKV